MKLVILLGKRAAGKSFLANLVKIECDYEIIEMSSHLKKLRVKYGLTNLRLRVFAEYLRKAQSKTYAIETLLNENTNELNKLILGVRHKEEIEYLKAKYDSTDIRIIYIHVNLLFRLIRALRRKDRCSMLEFFVEEFYSIKWHNSILKKYASHVVKNYFYKKSYSHLKELILWQ